jgi:hypothetical protein
MSDSSFDDLRRAADLLIEVLEELRGALRNEDFHTARESITCGEPGLGLETIAQQLFEYDLNIPRSTYDKLVRAGMLMKMPEKQWLFLLPRVI